MAMDAVVQVRMDKSLKQEAESLYSRLGTSFAEAIRLFARQSVAEQGLPFSVKVPLAGTYRQLGIADGEYEIPDDIDSDNGAIAELFGITS